MPALPAPTTQMRWSLRASRGLPCTVSAPYRPANAVAAVPCSHTLIRSLIDDPQHGQGLLPNVNRLIATAQSASVEPHSLLNAQREMIAEELLLSLNHRRSLHMSPGSPEQVPNTNLYMDRRSLAPTPMCRMLYTAMSTPVDHLSSRIFLGQCSRARTQSMTLLSIDAGCTDRSGWQFG